MIFETLTLWPRDGAVDTAAVTSWLDACPYAFKDPVENDGWHLSATPRSMALNRQARVEHPHDFPLGVRVKVASDKVWLAARADNAELARAFEFIEWLVRGAKWTAEVDGIDFGLVGDPRRLFPADLPDPATLVDDLTYSPVIEGTLVTWYFEHNGKPVLFAIHSSGSWRYETSDRRLRGRLSSEALVQWRAVIASTELDYRDQTEQPDSASTVSVEVETPEKSAWLYFDTLSPPTGPEPVVKMVADWIETLAHWVPGARVEHSVDVQTA